MPTFCYTAYEDNTMKLQSPNSEIFQQVRILYCESNDRRNVRNSGVNKLHISSIATCRYIIACVFISDAVILE